MRSLNRRLTDIELAKLEERIADLFGEARQELQKTSQDYWDNLVRREEVMMRKFDRGELTMEQYQKWYIAQVGRGKNYDTIINNMAKVLTDTNESAVAMTNDAMAGVYSLNRNISNYMIENLAGDGIDFALWNENAVRNMLLNQPDVMPYYPPERALDREIDLEYGKRMISRQTTLAIMQGKDINQIANSLMDKITGMERSSATRAARTAVGAAMNAGSLDSYEEAKGLGLKVEKQWEAGIDGRTRDSHIEMNGVRIPVEKKFPNGLMYPCDPYGRPEEVYNCRCCLIPILPETANKVKQEPHTEASYRAWQQEKIDAGKIIDLDYYKQNEFEGYNAGGFIKAEKTEKYSQTPVPLDNLVRPKRRDYDDEELFERDKTAYREARAKYNEQMQNICDEILNREHRFSNVSEVRQWAESLGVDITDELLSKIDIRVFDDFSYTMEELFTKYPQIRSFDFKDLDGNTFTSKFRIGYTNEHNALLNANAGINFSKDFIDYGDGLYLGLNSISTGHFVYGDGTIRSLYRHEFGHNVEDYLRLTKCRDIYDESGKIVEYGAKISSKLTAEIEELAGLEGASEYSNTNTCELFAEGFAAYASGQNTPFAMKFGELLKRWM